jgi:carboxyl-terminal processing protease
MAAALGQGKAAPVGNATETPHSTPSTEREFVTPCRIALEAEGLVNLLEKIHYNHARVTAADYGQIIPDYMDVLDNQHAYFIQDDLNGFVHEHAARLHDEIATRGDIDAGYRIFSVYQKRVQVRVAWILEHLAAEADFSTGERYLVDHSKEPWPKSEEAGNEQWTMRLRFELLNELLDGQTPDRARATIRNHYLQTLNRVLGTDEADVAASFLSTVCRLYDPHSSYIAQKQLEDAEDPKDRGFFGFGAILQLDGERCFVQRVLPGGPAALDGRLTAGDQIHSVTGDGGVPLEVAGMSLLEISGLTRGPRGSRLTLVVHHASAGDPSERESISLARDSVEMGADRAIGAIYRLPGGNGAVLPMGVVRVRSLYGRVDRGDRSPSVAEEVAKILEAMEQQGVQGVILDLRGSPGGLLNEAINLAGLFVNKQVIVRLRNSEGVIESQKSRDRKAIYTGPLLVLVDQSTSAGSETVAGSLQCLGRALVVGDGTTYGTNSVQVAISLKEVVRKLAFSRGNSGLALVTTEKIYLPDGSSCQRRGISPDITFPVFRSYSIRRESDLPRALGSDEIQGVDNHVRKPTAELLTRLRDKSRQRQDTLPEFIYLKRSLGPLDPNLGQWVSLNLEVRRKQIESDEAFMAELTARHALVVKDDFPSEQIHVDEEILPSFVKGSQGDVPLRESLRVLGDAVAAGWHN